MGDPWPESIAALEDLQRELARAAPPAWLETEGLDLRIAAGYVCFGRGGGGPGAAGDWGWAGAALFGAGEILATAVVSGPAGAGYDPGHLALREGPLLEAALSALPERPEAILVDATGRDHPRRAGLALHLGARLDVPSVGVTNRLLCATGALPEDLPRATCPFHLAGEMVGYWVRTRSGTRPLAVHAGWRTDPRTALALVLACTLRARTPEPLRAARRVAREARTRAAAQS